MAATATARSSPAKNCCRSAARPASPIRRRSGGSGCPSRNPPGPAGSAAPGSGSGRGHLAVPVELDRDLRLGGQRGLVAAHGGATDTLLFLVSDPRVAAFVYDPFAAATSTPAWVSPIRTPESMATWIIPAMPNSNNWRSHAFTWRLGSAVSGSSEVIRLLCKLVRQIPEPGAGCVRWSNPPRWCTAAARGHARLAPAAAIAWPGRLADATDE